VLILFYQFISGDNRADLSNIDIWSSDLSSGAFYAALPTYITAYGF